MLSIKNLHAQTDGIAILKGLNLEISTGEIVALMGPNGSGKSTLAHVLAGHPSYEVTEGSITFNGEDLLAMKPEERAAAGLFLAFQYPASIPGVSVSHFLRLAINSQRKSRGEELVGVAPFIRLLREKMKQLHIPADFAERSVNEGFSGGEKKRLEMLQMLMLQPKLVILDEVDSGLDIDAMRIVASAVESLDLEHTSVVSITHYQRLLDYIKPTSIHVMKDGQIIRSGTAILAEELERTGYQTI